MHGKKKGGGNVILPACFCFNGNSYLNSSTLAVISAVIELVINGFTESRSSEEALCWLLYIRTYSSISVALPSLLSQRMLAQSHSVTEWNILGQGLKPISGLDGKIIKNLVQCLLCKAFL